MQINISTRYGYRYRFSTLKIINLPRSASSDSIQFLFHPKKPFNLRLS